MSNLIDPTGPTWKAIAEYTLREISDARDALEAQGMTAEATEFHRGRIYALREVLTLAEQDFG